MKIGVVGSGALGSFYGAKLALSGLDVHFLMRSDYEMVRRHGLTIRSSQGDFHLHPRCANQPSAIGQCDLVLIGLKTTANDQFRALLTPLTGPHTALLTLQNGLGNEEQLAELFNSDQILGGLCFVCLNRLAPGLVQHISFGQIVLGEFRRSPQTRTHHIAGLFRQAGVPCEIAENLERAHWEKLVWNIPFNGLGVASAAGYQAVVAGKLDHPPLVRPCLSTEQLLADSGWFEIVRQLMLEVIHTANALGHPIPESLADQHIARTRAMGAYKASTVIDFERQQPLELESLFLNPFRHAQKTGVAAPRLQALCQILQSIDPGGGFSNLRYY